MSKSPVASKTLWVNGLTLGVVVLTALVDHTLITENPAILAALTMALSGANMVLRFLTNKPLSSR